jgi:hypothetical protein
MSMPIAAASPFVMIIIERFNLLRFDFNDSPIASGEGYHYPLVVSSVACDFTLGTVEGGVAQPY